jgi:hypothetical protein
MWPNHGLPLGTHPLVDGFEKCMEHMGVEPVTSSLGGEWFGRAGIPTRLLVFLNIYVVD